MKVEVSNEAAKKIASYLVVDATTGEVSAPSIFEGGYAVDGDGQLRLWVEGVDEGAAVDGDDVPEQCRAGVAWILEVSAE